MEMSKEGWRKSGACTSSKSLSISSEISFANLKSSSEENLKYFQLKQYQCCRFLLFFFPAKSTNVSCSMNAGLWDNPGWMPAALQSCSITLITQLDRREEIQGKAPGLRWGQGEITHPLPSQAAGKSQLQCLDLILAPSALTWVWAGMFLSHILTPLFSGNNYFCTVTFFHS